MLESTGEIGSLGVIQDKDGVEGIKDGATGFWSLGILRELRIRVQDNGILERIRNGNDRI